MLFKPDSSNSLCVADLSLFIYIYFSRIQSLGLEPQEDGAVCSPVIQNIERSLETEQYNK